MRQQVMTNPHSPEMYRANGPVRNIPEFYQTFGVKEGDKMYLAPEKRTKIWWGRTTPRSAGLQPRRPGVPKGPPLRTGAR
jgi:hypothetical protein